MATHDTRLLTVAEVADRLGLPRMTVFRLVHSGELPATRFGRSFHVSAAAVEAFEAVVPGDGAVTESA